jgi:hypothetical protein
METRPPALAEAVVGRLIPPACREHVLGDLRERYTTLPRYVVDVLAVVPMVVASQIRRTFDGTLFALEVWMLGMALLGRPIRYGSANGVDDVATAIPIAIMLVVLILCDAYAPVRAASSDLDHAEALADARFGAGLVRAVHDVVLAIACSWLVELILGRIAGDLRISIPRMLDLTGIWFLLLGAWRAAWWTVFTPGSRRMFWPAAQRQALGQAGVAQFGWLGMTMPLGRVAWQRLGAAPLADRIVGSLALAAAGYVCFRVVVRAVLVRRIVDRSAGSQQETLEVQRNWLRWWRPADALVVALPLVLDALRTFVAPGTASRSAWSFGLYWALIAWTAAELNARAAASFEHEIDALGPPRDI